MDDVGMMNRSLAELERSRSCQRGTFSRATPSWLRRSLDSEVIRSLLMGLRFTGTALLPICPFANLSATSPISVLWRFLISTAIFSRVDPTRARANTYSAYLSRGTTCVATGAGSIPSASATSLCTSTAARPISEPVPTTPRVLHITTRSRIWPSRRPCSAISSAQLANFSPKDMMLACWPCVRPTAGRSAYIRAVSASIRASSDTLGSMMSSASLICMELLVSTRSLLVRP